jgi:hypothetical protein
MELHGVRCYVYAAQLALNVTSRTTRVLAYAEGNYKEYEADLHRRKGIDADQPKRIKYKALVRG